MTVERLKQCMPVHRRCLLPSIMLAMLLGGCGDTSKSPEAPTVLGTPPSTAYLGADYSYNFGAHGGDNLLNYSLSNAPSWLALEETTNNARPGIVLRGQPGITGGKRGKADVGTYEQIKISSTDGALLGDGDFTIEVLHNALMIQDATITEGQAFQPDVNDRDEEVCEFPDMGQTWEAEVEHRRLRTDTGTANLEYETAERDYTAYPALVEVQLNEPSVEPVSVMFRVQEDFPRAVVGPEGDLCGEDNNGKPCEYAPGNRGKAIYGEDFVFNGGPDGRDMVAPGSDFPDPPEYIRYVEEGFNESEGDDEDGIARYGRGVLTFEPGITSCFIPVWVFDDDLAEDTESFDIILEEVTEGLASLEEEGAISDLSIDIEDTTPRARFDLDELVVTAGDDTEREMTVSLSRANDTGEALWAGIECVDESDEGESGVCDRVTLRHGDESRDGEESSLPVSFDTGESELSFSVEVTANGDGHAYADDQRFQLTFDRAYQSGLEFAAGVSENEEVDVFINEWDETLVLENGRWTSVVAGTFGEAYLAGVGTDQELTIRSINRLGNTDGEDSAVLTDGDDWEKAADGVPPRLAFSDRSTGTSSAPEITRNLAVGYTSEDGDGVLALFRSRLQEDDDEDNGDDLVLVCDEAKKEDGRLWRFISSEEEEVGLLDVKTLNVSGDGDVFLGGTQGDDILLSRVDSAVAEEDSDDPCDPPERERASASFQWSNLIGAGGGLESDVVGLTRPTFGNMSVLGWSAGDISSGNELGGETFLFLSLDEDGEVASDNQFGTNWDDRFSHGVEAGTRLWAGGTGQVRYERDENGAIDEEASEFIGRDNPFIFALSGGGNVEGLINFAEEDGESDFSRITALAADDTTAFAAGDAETGSAPFLVSVTLNAEEEEVEEDWRIELSGASSVVDLSVFEGRKLFVLLEDAGTYELRLYSREGTALTQLTP